MTAFRFRLERVLHVRNTQLKNEEFKLEALLQERIRMQAELQAADELLDRERHAIESAAYTRSSELLAFERFKQRAARERGEALKRLAAQDVLVARQRAAIVDARRGVMLLEKLREKRQAVWQVEVDKEMEEPTADFTAAQWLRGQQT